MGGFLNVVVCGFASEDTVVVVIAVGVTFVVTDAILGGGGLGGGTFLARPVPASLPTVDAGVVARVLGKLVPSIEEHSARASGVDSTIDDVGVAGGEAGFPTNNKYAVKI